jgi:ATP/maltotriose-dependent transcriptional regulator MalT
LAFTNYFLHNQKYWLIIGRTEEMKSEAQGHLKNGPPTLKSNSKLLSSRELEIIDIIMEGLTTTGFSDEEVAARMNVAVGTVRTCIKRIYQKLQAEEYSSLVQLL